MLLESRLEQGSKRLEGHVAALESFVKGVQAGAEKNIDEAREECRAGLKGVSGSLEKGLSGVGRELELRCSKLSEDQKVAENRTKENFLRSREEGKESEKGVLLLIREQEEKRERLSRHFEEGLSGERKFMEHNFGELLGKIENESATRNREVNALGGGVAELQRGSDDLGAEIEGVKMQLVREYCNKDELKKGLELSGRELEKEATRRMRGMEVAEKGINEALEKVRLVAEASGERGNELERLLARVRQELGMSVDEVRRVLSSDVKGSLERLDRGVLEGKEGLALVAEKGVRDLERLKEAMEGGLGETRQRIADSGEYLNKQAKSDRESIEEKWKKIRDDLEKVQSAVAAESSVRMLDVENVFGRLNLVREDMTALQIAMDGEKRQRISIEENERGLSETLSKLSGSILSPKALSPAMPSSLTPSKNSNSYSARVTSQLAARTLLPYGSRDHDLSNSNF